MSTDLTTLSCCAESRSSKPPLGASAKTSAVFALRCAGKDCSRQSRKVAAGGQHMPKSRPHTRHKLTPLAALLARLRVVRRRVSSGSKTVSS